MDLSSHFSLQGKTALVTGASRGIGRGIATTLGAAGAVVVVTARSTEGLEETKAEIEALGGSAVVVTADLESDDDTRRMVEEATAVSGGIDVLVNNAASPRRAMSGPAHLMPLEFYDITMLTNLRAPFVLTQLVAKGMIERGTGGAIVHITSVAGLVGSANLAVYSATKAALTRWAEATAAEWGAYGIRVNCVSPGLIQTEATRPQWGDPESRDILEKAISLHRLGQAEDIGLATLFLASSAADYITGATLQVDGGMIVGTMARNRKQPANPAESAPR